MFKRVMVVLIVLMGLAVSATPSILHIFEPGVAKAAGNGMRWFYCKKCLLMIKSYPNALNYQSPCTNPKGSYHVWVNDGPVKK
jgi:hypothetical protein